MAKDPREQQKTDAGRIADRGAGQLDDTKNKDAVVPQASEAKSDRLEEDETPTD